MSCTNNECTSARTKEHLHRYSTFVRIGTGFSYADYLVIRSKNWQQWDPKNPPSFLQTAKKTSEDKGDVYLEPEEYVRFQRTYYNG